LAEEVKNSLLLTSEYEISSSEVLDSLRSAFPSSNLWAVRYLGQCKYQIQGHASWRRDLIQAGSLMLRQQQFFVSQDLSCLYSPIKSIKVWLKIWDLEYDMWSFHGLAAVTHPFGNLLDLDFGTKARSDIRCARVLVEVATLDLISAFLWFEVRRPDGWVSYVRVRYVLDGTTVPLVPDPSMISSEIRAAFPTPHSHCPPPMTSPTARPSAPVPTLSVTSVMQPMVHHLPAFQQPVQLTTPCPPPSTVHQPVRSQPVRSHSGTTVPAPPISRITARPPLSVISNSPIGCPPLNPLPLPSTQQPSTSVPPQPAKSASTHNLAPKAAVFKKPSKHKVWYNKTKKGPVLSQTSVLLAENKALKAQLDLLKALGTVSVPPSSSATWTPPCPLL
jgi:Domain of unknown function (DUF4283)